MLVILLESLRLFNKGKFFHAHEQLEELWQSYRGDDRPYYQALIQLMVTCHLLSENRVTGAIKVDKRATNNLKDYDNNIACVDIVQLLKDVLELLKIASELGDNPEQTTDKTVGLKLKLELSKIRIKPKDVVLYDDTCFLCSNSIGLIMKLMNRLGLESLGINSEFAQKILKLPKAHKVQEIKMFTKEFTLVSGVEVFTCMLSRIPILLPFLYLLDLPPFRSIFKGSYRFIAANRYKFNAVKDWLLLKKR